MKRMLQNMSDALADAALLERGVEPAVRKDRRPGPGPETLEELFIEAAFAEAADYDDIREAILREHRSERNTGHSDDCRCGDNDLCCVS